MTRVGAFLLFPTICTVVVLAQITTPTYRVPSDYAYFAAEKKELPPYPSEALRNEIGGDVILVVEFSTDGSVEVANRISGNSLLVPAGIQAIKNWKFRPIKEKGQKAKGIAYIGFHFVPTDSKVFASFPLGKWEQTPAADPAGTEGANQPALVHIGRGIAAQNKIGGANPNYPQAAKWNHIEGPVELRAIIDREGHISLLEVMKTPSPDLAISAVEAVKTWQYKPYSLNGENVDVETEVVVNYELR